MKTGAYFILIIAVLIYIAVTVTNQLTGEKTPAEAFCSAARGEGMKCEVMPDQFSAQIVVVSGVQGSAGYAVIYKDGKIAGVIPLPKQGE